MPAEADTYPLMRNFWRTKLFEHGFPDWLRDFVLDRSMNWSVIITELFAGRAVSRDHRYDVGEFLCHQMLPRLTVMAFAESKDRSIRDAILRSLQLDGFDVNNEQLRRIDGPVSIEEEKSRLLAFLKASKLGRQDVVAKHIKEAEDLFGQGKYHPAIGEARSALQAIVEETVTLVEGKSGRKSGSGFKNQIEFLERESFLSADDVGAFLAAWGFLCSGNHPGLSSEEQGRIGTVLCLEFSQILLIKGKALL